MTDTVELTFYPDRLDSLRNDAFVLKEKSTIINEIEKLEKAKDLLASVMATLTLERNREIIPEPLEEIVEIWKQQFDRLK